MGNAGERRVYNSLRREYYWSHMAIEVYTNEKDCHECVCSKAASIRQRVPQLFLPSNPFKFVAMDTLGLLSKTLKGNQFVLVITDLYSKLTRAVLTCMTTVSHILSIFMNSRVTPYRFPIHEWTENGTQCISEFSKTLCAFLGTKHLENTAYHTQAKGQAERFNKTIVARLRQ